MAQTYAYQVDKDDKLRYHNPNYEITSFFPELRRMYPFLVGLAVLAPQSCLTLVMGQLADRLNRVRLYSGFAFMWSLMTVLQGTTTSLEAFCMLRIFFGCFACTGPASSSIIRDTFSHRYRATANGIFLTAGFLGGGLASLTILMTAQVGWQKTYQIIGAAGMIVAVLFGLLVHEPVRGRHDGGAIDNNQPALPLKAQINLLFKSKCTRWLFPAAFLRYGGSFSLLFYMPIFFTQTYPEHISEFS